MKCDEVRVKLSEYLDGELSREEKKPVDEHLEGCDGCRSVLAELERTVGHLRAMGDVEPPPWFTQKVMQRVREEAGKKKGLFRWLFYPLHVKLPVEALAVAVVAVAAVYIFNIIKPEVQMNVATKPVAEAPMPAEQEEGAVALRGEMKEAAPSERKDLEDRVDVLRKSAEPQYRAEKRGAVPDRAHAPTVGEAEVKKGLAFEEAYSASQADRGVGERAYEYEISLLVGDEAEAREAVGRAVERVGGDIIEDEPAAEENVVFAEVSPARLDGLIKELGEVGEVSAGTPVVYGDYVRVRIELRERQ